MSKKAIKKKHLTIDGFKIPVYSINTLIVGSGAAGLNAALTLHELGQRDLCLVTERLGAGTSFNAGSDKQTFYKQSLAGAMLDSPRRMAEDLFNGGCMHGDVALCEAQGSARSFFNMVRLGVPFPYDRYGAFVGYRTDHDPLGRGTSAGPLTSRMMGQCLARAVRMKRIAVLEGHTVVALLHDGAPDGERRVLGALALCDGGKDQGRRGFVLFNAVNVILATGGPGELYRTSVYPPGQSSSIGMALAAGARAHNLTESQFGLASIGFRWNLSGSYQQVIPRYYSAGPRGGDEQAFLNGHFPDMETLAGAIFRKGYEWPLDAGSVMNHGSSLIDLLVYHETEIKKRRVFLDYTRNPESGTGLKAFSLNGLDGEATLYLAKSRALKPTPIERLEAMNPQAVDLFRKNGIDLSRDPLEIGLCAQHNNGGLIGDLWWESNVRHLFPVGEVNGTHGVRRPGGAALNAGQVGSFRAALFIAANYGGPPPDVEAFMQFTRSQVKSELALAERMTRKGPGRGVTPGAAVRDIQERMSACGAAVRDPAKVKESLAEAWRMHEKLVTHLLVSSPAALPTAFRTLDLCLTHAVYLEALQEYLNKGGLSRGSFLVLDREGISPSPGLGKEWRFRLNDPDDFVNHKILEVRVGHDLKVSKRWVDIRPIPEEDLWFETVWNDFVNQRMIRREDRDE